MNISISMRAIFAGVIVALAMQTLLNLLGLGLGLIAFRINPDVIANETLTSVVWLVVTSGASMFVGGWIAARVANSNLASVGVLHGIVTWGLATLATFLLVGPTAEILVGGTTSLLIQELFTSGQMAINARAGVSHIDPTAAQVFLKTGEIMGSAAIIIFCAFVFSAITSVLGAMCAARCKK
jgi:hypothetical protein